MKYLIDGQRNVLRKGEFVEATSQGEFIYDTDTVADQKEVTVAVLTSILSSAGIRNPKGATRTDMIENLNNNLPNLEIPEQKTMTQSAIISEVVKTAGEKREPGTDPDVFEVDVFTACIERLNAEGVTFKIKQLGKLVQQEIAEQGFVMSNVQRKNAVYSMLDDAKFKPAAWSDVEAMIEKVTKEVTDTDESKALSLIKKWCKENELEAPKREKPPKLSYRQRAINFMIENSPVTDAALKKFIVEECKKDEDALDRLASLRETIDAAFAAGVASTQPEEEAEAA